MEIQWLRLVRSPSTDPWVNLAWEEHLTHRCADGEAILFLWQNARTVVIGRNQNAWAECRLDLLDADGGKLARRSTGGGAVYHDLGNLNFSFVTRRENYSMPEQLRVVLEALKKLGVDASFTGRNDLTLDGRKFSGNAYQLTKTTGLHHGTLLVNVDMDVMPRYLSVDPEKLKSKGVASVKSRVINLVEVAPKLTIPNLKDALEKAFLAHYRHQGVVLEQSIPGNADFIALHNLYKSREWLYGRSPQCEIQVKKRFTWGGIELHFDVKSGSITNLRVYSDAMDGEMVQHLSATLESAPFSWQDMAQIIESKLISEQQNSEISDLAAWFRTSPAVNQETAEPQKNGQDSGTGQAKKN